MSSLVKRDRPTAEHIMKVLEANKGIALRASSISRLMITEGNIHTMNAILDNLNILIEQGKVMKVEKNQECRRHYYGIPNIREDGTAYLIETKRDGTKREIECGKLNQNGA